VTRDELDRPQKGQGDGLVPQAGDEDPELGGKDPKTLFANIQHSITGIDKTMAIIKEYGTGGRLGSH
jgi:hypothetical protein